VLTPRWASRSWLASPAPRTRRPQRAWSAAVALLDRGWGKPEQSHVGLDGGDIKVTIRQIVEGVDED
jgi:hypothetical protein